MLTYDMNLRGDMPLYEFLYESIASDIRSGVLPASRKLPSKRALAKHLGVSLITVETAFSQLIAEGYIHSVERRGYYVCDLPHTSSAAANLDAGCGTGSDALGVRFSASPRRRDAGCGTGSDAFGVRIGAAPRRRDGGEALGRDDAFGGEALGRDDAFDGDAPGRGDAFDGDAPGRGDAFIGDDVPDACDGFLVGRAPGGVCIPTDGAAYAENGPLSHIVYDLRGGALSSSFPYEAWARFMREALSRESESELCDTKSPLGTLRLRRVLADYLREYRGMSVSAQQIVIGAGAQYLYGMIIQLLNSVRGSCHVAIENPGYPRLEKIYRVNRVPVSYIPMDDQGIRMDVLSASGANVVHLTPSHQFPTGLVTSIPRRYELLSWAAQDSNRFIIEDDYDCEFRLAGRPIAPLQRLDAQGQVIYTNTFTKSLGGAFRIGYMVLPPQLAVWFERELGFYSCSVSAVDQLALARFIESGSYERHVNRMRTRYRALRDSFIDALDATPLSSRMQIRAKDSGIHFLLGISASLTGVELSDRAAQEGVAIDALQRFYQGNAPEESELRWFVAGYSSLEASQTEPCACALARAWEPS